jgi:chromosome segregation ATPase
VPKLPAKLIATLLVVAIHALPAVAQVERTGGGASAQIMQQYQQASAERSALQAANEKMKKELDDTKSQLASANKQLLALRSNTNSSQAAVAAALTSKKAADDALEQTRTKLQELIGRFRDMTATLAGVETERNQLKQQVAASAAQYDKCAQTNFELYQVARESLDRLDHQGIFSAIARSEPLTRIQRTRLENLVDEYRIRAEQLRVERQGSAPVAPKAN